MAYLRAGLAVAALLGILEIQTGPPHAPVPGTGTVCVLSIADPTPGEKSLFNDTGGNPAPDYSVQFDAGAIIAIPHSPKGRGPGVLVTDFALDASPMVRIRHQGKPIESFRLHFDPDDHAKACLSMDAFYLEWRVWSGRRLRLCDCQDAARVSWTKR
jgi:hypothetical protein